MSVLNDHVNTYLSIGEALEGIGFQRVFDGGILYTSHNQYRIRVWCGWGLPAENAYISMVISCKYMGDYVDVGDGTCQGFQEFMSHLHHIV